MSEVFGGVAEHAAVAFVRILVLEEAVQERGVHRIDADFERLQPVAIDHALERERVGRRRDEAVELRERRRLAGAEIGPQDAALLHDRIGFLLDVGAQIAVVRLGRRLQAFAVDVEQPAVKGAAQAAVFEPAIGQIGAAMRAMPPDQPIAALVVLEGDQVLAEEPHRFDRPVAGKLIDQRRRLPVAAHQIAGRGAGRSAGDEIVLFRAQHRRFPRCFANPSFNAPAAPRPSGSPAASFSTPRRRGCRPARPAKAGAPGRGSAPACIG